MPVLNYVAVICVLNKHINLFRFSISPDWLHRVSSLLGNISLSVKLWTGRVAVAVKL